MLPGIWEHFTLTFVLSHQGRGDFAPLAGRCVSLPILLSFVSEDAGSRPCRGSGGISPSPSSSPIEVEDILPPLRGGKKCRTPPAGSLRVSLNSSFSPQDRRSASGGVGARGLKGDSFDSLHPEGIYGGFPVKHGMTYYVVIMMTLYQPGLPLKFCPAIILDKGVDELSHTPQRI